MPNLADYELLDSGNLQKLERIGKYILNRPCPQAYWRPLQPKALWDTAHATYHRRGDSGDWEFFQKIPEKWSIPFFGMKWQLRPTPFGHTGLFTEQIPNLARLEAKLTELGHANKIK